MATEEIEKRLEEIKSTIAKESTSESVEAREVNITPEVLIIGGGITGMYAALDVADAGFKVHLVERSPTIGGHMAQLDKTFPTLDCSDCIITPRMVDVGAHPNIDLMTCSEVVEVKGSVGNFEVNPSSTTSKLSLLLSIGIFAIFRRSLFSNPGIRAFMSSISIFSFSSSSDSGNGAPRR